MCPSCPLHTDCPLQFAAQGTRGSEAWSHGTGRGPQKHVHAHTQGQRSPLVKHAHASGPPASWLCAAQVVSIGGPVCGHSVPLPHYAGIPLVPQRQTGIHLCPRHHIVALPPPDPSLTPVGPACMAGSQSRLRWQTPSCCLGVCRGVCVQWRRKGGGRVCMVYRCTCMVYRCTCHMIMLVSLAGEG